jgi:hypothetical protein
LANLETFPNLVSISCRRGPTLFYAPARSLKGSFRTDLTCIAPLVPLHSLRAHAGAGVGELHGVAGEGGEGMGYAAADA